MTRPGGRRLHRGELLCVLALAARLHVRSKPPPRQADGLAGNLALAGTPRRGGQVIEFALARYDPGGGFEHRVVRAPLCRERILPALFGGCRPGGRAGDRLPHRDRGVERHRPGLRPVRPKVPAGRFPGRPPVPQLGLAFREVSDGTSERADTLADGVQALSVRQQGLARDGRVRTALRLVDAISGVAQFIAGPLKFRLKRVQPGDPVFREVARVGEVRQDCTGRCICDPIGAPLLEPRIAGKARIQLIQPRFSRGDFFAKLLTPA